MTTAPLRGLGWAQGPAPLLRHPAGFAQPQCFSQGNRGNIVLDWFNFGKAENLTEQAGITSLSSFYLQLAKKRECTNIEILKDTLKKGLLNYMMLDSVNQRTICCTEHFSPLFLHMHICTQQSQVLVQVVLKWNLIFIQAQFVQDILKLCHPLLCKEIKY